MQIRSKRWMIMVLVCALALQGCITTAVLLTTALISHSKSRNTDYATTTVDATPDKVYEAELKAMEKHPDIKITKKDPKQHTIEATMGNDRIITQADPTADGKTRFRVLATSPDPLTASENPALDIEEDTLEEMKIKYKVEE